MGRTYNLSNIARLSGLVHDIGKYTKDFQEYIAPDKSSKDKQAKGSVIHSIYGAMLIEHIADSYTNQNKQLPENRTMAVKITKELMMHAVQSHHGIRDCVNIAGEITYYKTIKKNRKSNNIEENFKDILNIVNKDGTYIDLLNEFDKAIEETDINISKLKDIAQSISDISSENQIYFEEKSEKDLKNLAYEPYKFLLGMYMRLLDSLLMESDVQDAKIFENDIKISDAIPEVDHNKWDEFASSIEKTISTIETQNKDNKLIEYRKQISHECKVFDNGGSGVFKLMVPCGGGKTMASLRHAVNIAKKYKKDRIFYISPFNSILEQNAQEIKKALNDDNLVLEHHSNFVPEDSKEEVQSKYENQIENWRGVPIIATSAVQFFNTLFSNKKSAIRRMQALGNSIIIVDEIQLLPTKIIKLQAGAYNFLSYFCNSYIVLCSATQPLLDKIDEFALINPQNIVKETYSSEFKRVREELVYRISKAPLDSDIINKKIQEFCIDNSKVEKVKELKLIQDFIYQKTNGVNSILAIFNTKKCCKEVYKSLKQIMEQENELKTQNGEEFIKYNLFHLSTNMCPAHRRKKISEIKESLKDESVKTICISTSLIEAGVDISFETVIRSLTGLESIIQSAGRCNRNGTRPTDESYIHVVKMTEDAESIIKLPELVKKQKLVEGIFDRYKENIDIFSEEVINKYYELYYYGENSSKLMRYQAEFDLTDLFSINQFGIKKFKVTDGVKSSPEVELKHALNKAGELFDIIEDEGKESAIVLYDDNAKKLFAELKNSKFDKNLNILRKLQPYVVQVQKEELDRVAYRSELEIYIVNKLEYSEEVGLDKDSIPSANMYIF